MQSMNIFAFGDSITYGAWDREGGWVQRLRKKLEERDRSTLVYNLGISGDTTRDILKRFDTDLIHRFDDDDESIILFCIGTNDDVVWSHDQGKFWVEPEEYRMNLVALYDKACVRTHRVAFLSLIPVDETKTNPSPWDPSAAYLSKNILRYQKILEEVCENQRIPLIDIYTPLQKDSLDLVLADGLHPNEEGHERISRAVHEFLLSRSWV